MLTTQSSCSLYEVQRKLRAFKEQNVLYLGFSSAFNDIYALSRHLQQARLMLVYALKQHTDLMCEFDHMVLPMMLDRILGGFDKDVFLINPLRDLYTYDKVNETEYIHTLAMYLENNLSLSQTANVLYIARSSLQYRIHRIEQILHLRLSDPKTVLYLRIALHLQE